MRRMRWTRSSKRTPGTAITGTYEEASLGVYFPRTTWPVRDLHALINELPALPPDTPDECDDEDIDDERERE